MHYVKEATASGGGVDSEESVHPKKQYVALEEKNTTTEVRNICWIWCDFIITV